MSERNTLARTAHDLGAAAWFGGSLMGAVGLNGATAQATSSPEALRLASVGWGRWAPVQTVAIAAHTLGGIGLIAGNRRRLEHQDEAQGNTAVKTVLTVAAVGLTAYSGSLGKQVYENRGDAVQGVTEPASTTDSDLAAAQKHLQWTQWAIPVVTGVLVVLGAQQGEQQRPSQQARVAVKNPLRR
ncbi:MAG TPA: hypothetical protein VJ976_00445 [Ornithinimicrobium sp.]|uniref:hypothetical protein n=1 Tax=Ornithinimicrobium sp. TaxID=1977084 RepID=UPI002B4683E1|nr:hypothetical protein [Ornithinimicrobium sp.]HKJ10835.1 hypothetical protein [Ornithinimicrobium sp.]